ncbi:hypothetical protein [Rhizobium sp. SG570]|uniref:hypothetical protein n=1 Tax=Rhizobium sp. SG570 TaxID=2587113 RepID=UPI001FF0628E|nr:hypothetical protein [Rhizobium sp. SG570]
MGQTGTILARRGDRHFVSPERGHNRRSERCGTVFCEEDYLRPADPAELKTGGRERIGYTIAVRIDGQRSEHSQA